MRYDREIIFCTLGQSVYDRKTGDYTESDPTEVRAYASVQETDIETQKIVYGELRRGSLTIHLQNHHSEPFDYIRIGDRKYSVDIRKTYRTKEGYVIHEG